MAKGRLAPVGWEGQGWETEGEGREEAGVRQRKTIGAERERCGTHT